MSVEQTLRGVPLFADLNDGEMDRLCRRMRTKSYPKNSVIVFEDDPGDALYVVNSGQVKVVLIGEDGREVILSVLGEGDFFGEMALIDDQPRSAHVMAMDDCKVLVLYRDDFHRCLEEAPKMALGLLRQLSRRLRSADDQIGGLALLDVSGRVARILIQLADEGDGVLISRRITYHTLAQMIGSSRETVSRTIKDLSSNGLVAVTKSTIEIRDRARLETLGGLA